MPTQNCKKKPKDNTSLLSTNSNLDEGGNKRKDKQKATDQRKTLQELDKKFKLKVRCQMNFSYNLVGVYKPHIGEK